MVLLLVVLLGKKTRVAAEVAKVISIRRMTDCLQVTMIAHNLEYSPQLLVFLV